MIEKLISTASDVIIGRDSDDGTLVISCIGGTTIEVHRGGQVSVDPDGRPTVEGLSVRYGVPDAPPPYLR